MLPLPAHRRRIATPVLEPARPMAPRLRLLLLLTACPLGACADAAEERASALRLAIEGGRASLAAVAPAPPPAAIPPAAPALVAATAPGRQPAAATQLLGLAPEALRQRLGEPSLRRAEGDAEIWLYAGTACALDLILYPAAGRLRVAQASARASGAEPRTEAHCLRELAAGPARRPLPATGAPPARVATPAPDRGA